VFVPIVPVVPIVPIVYLTVVVAIVTLASGVGDNATGAARRAPTTAATFASPSSIIVSLSVAG
jgi:hypothetical protein